MMSDARVEGSTRSPRGLICFAARARRSMFVAVDGRAGRVASRRRPDQNHAAEAVDQLHAAGLRIVLLSGDNRVTAEAVGKKLGIDRVIADVLPAQKAEVVRDLQAEGRVVAMAGDGINDAPALAAADVGIAMGSGTDVAMESSGVTLVKGDLRGIAKARNLSRAVDGEYPTKPVLRLRLQRRGCTDRGRRLVPSLRPAPQSDDRRRRNEPQFRLGHCQRPQAPRRRTLIRCSGSSFHVARASHDLDGFDDADRARAQTSTRPQSAPVSGVVRSTV